ncbi:MAG: hypothetical protein WAW78_10365 [Propioniciclava sp.]|jgi:hypothetical protein
MATQRERRTDPYPLTWEIPVAMLAGSLLSLVLGVHLGRAMANLGAGAGWMWPATAQLFRSVFGVLQGDASAGLDSTASLAEPDALLAWMLAVALVVMATYVFLTWLRLRRWAPNRVLGLTSADEVRQLLGRQRLYGARKVIRPDLYGRRPR